MKTILKKLAILFIFFGCYSCDSEDFQQLSDTYSPDVNGCYSCDSEDFRQLSDTCFPDVNDCYTYPIVPGTDKWQKLSSIDEAFQVCQLPDKTLKSISTPGLIDAIAYSPMFVGHYMLSSSSPVETWHMLYAKLNSVQELFDRDDAGEVLVAYYKAIDFRCINSNEEHYITESERLSGIEFLFTKQEVLNKISHQKKQELVEALLSNYNQKIERSSIIVPIAWIMFNDNYQPMMAYYTSNVKQYEQSIHAGYVFSKEQSESIVSIANDFINE